MVTLRMVYEFPVCAVTNYHKFLWLTKQEIYSLTVLVARSSTSVSLGQSQGVSKLHSLGSSREESGV